MFLPVLFVLSACQFAFAENWKPDIIITLSSPDSLSHSGRDVAIQGTVKNIGNLPVYENQRFQVRLECLGKEVKTKEFSGLQVGKTKNFEFHYRWTNKGIKNCVATVEDISKIDELNKDNNSAETTIIVK